MAGAPETPPLVPQQGGNIDHEDIIRCSGYIRKQEVEHTQDRWEPCMMAVLGNQFSVCLGTDRAANCAMDVCSVKLWAPPNSSEILPLEECATYFACTGLIVGSDLLETFICSSLDALGSWFGVMETAVSRMSIRNLRVYAMHDVEGFSAINSKYFGDLIEPPEEDTADTHAKKNTVLQQVQTPSRVPVNSYPFFPHFAGIFIAGWILFRFILKLEVVAMSRDLFLAILSVVFYIGRDCALPWERPKTVSPQRKRADAGLFEDGKVEGAASEGEVAVGGGGGGDESWKRFEDTTTVARLLQSGVSLKTAEEFTAAFAASGPNKWVNPPGDVFWLRGKKYLEDRQKYQSIPCYFPLIGCDLWKVVSTIEGGPGPQRCIGRHPQNYVQKVLRNPQIDPVVAAQVEAGGDVHIFVMNFLLPFGNFVGYWLRPWHPDSDDDHTPTPQSEPLAGDLSDSDNEMGSAAPGGESGDGKIGGYKKMTASDKLTRSLYDAFISGDDDYRNARLKVSPRVFAGPWLVKRAVGKGNKAAKLGEQIPLSYDRGPNHFEVMVDVSSSALGNRILSVVTTYIKAVTIDLGFIIEGTTEEELPERVLGALRFYALEVEDAPFLPPMNFDNSQPQEQEPEPEKEAP